MYFHLSRAFTLSTQISCTTIFKEKTDFFNNSYFFIDISCQQAKHLQLECLFKYMFLTWLLVIDIEFSLILAILENETQFLMLKAFNYLGKEVKNLQKMEKISYQICTSF